MSFLYPRVISIARPTVPASVATIGYGGVSSAASETIVLTNLPASIQAKSGSVRASSGDVPSAAPGPVLWNIYLPKLAAVPRGAILDRDVVIDDQGERYQVTGAYWHSMGHKLITRRLEAH